jgi:glutaconate CoA-transferase subunit B
MEPDETGELVLTALHPDATADQVRENTGWELKVADSLRLTLPPGAEELRILREDLDPQGIYLKGSAG